MYAFCTCLCAAIVFATSRRWQLCVQISASEGQRCNSSLFENKKGEQGRGIRIIKKKQNEVKNEDIKE
jgi:hypothetical protein